MPLKTTSFFTLEQGDISSTPKEWCKHFESMWSLALKDKSGGLTLGGTSSWIGER